MGFVFLWGNSFGGCKPAGKLQIQKNIASNKKQTIVVDNHFDNPLSPSQPPQTCGFVASVSPWTNTLMTTVPLNCEMIVAEVAEWRPHSWHLWPPPGYSQPLNFSSPRVECKANTVKWPNKQSSHTIFQKIPTICGKYDKGHPATKRMPFEDNFSVLDASKWFWTLWTRYCLGQHPG